MSDINDCDIDERKNIKISKNIKVDYTLDELWETAKNINKSERKRFLYNNHCQENIMTGLLIRWQKLDK